MRYEREDIKADSAHLEAGSGYGLVQRSDSERGIQFGEPIVAGKVAQQLGLASRRRQRS
jgi:hypothetical protein